MKLIAIAVVTLLYVGFDVALLSATGYVVFWLNHSGWWFLLAVLWSSGMVSPYYKAMNAINGHFAKREKVA